MGWHAWVSLGGTAVMVVAMARGRIPPDVVLLGGLTVFVTCGSITVDQAFGGFANEGMLTVAKNEAGMLTVMTGCYRGTLDEFVAAVAKTHGDNAHGRAYTAAVSLIRATIGKETPDA
jgi:hypothetical protein